MLNSQFGSELKEWSEEHAEGQKSLDIRGQYDLSIDGHVPCRRHGTVVALTSIVLVFE